MDWNKKLRTALASGVIALVFLLAAGTAQAVTNVIRIGETAVAIRDLALNGSLYDVEFIFDNANNVYANPATTADLDFTTRTDSDAAATAITVALKAEGGIISVGDFNVGNKSFLFMVPFVVNGQQISRSVGFEQGGGNWFLYPDPSQSLISNVSQYAKFTRTGNVPEPGTAMLLGLGLAGLFVAGRPRHA